MTQNGTIKEYLIANNFIDKDNEESNENINIERGIITIRKNNKNYIGVTINKIENNIYEFSPCGEYVNYKEFAWYVYDDESRQPIAKKSKYTTEKLFRYIFKNPGKYRVKMYYKNEINEKASVFSEFFMFIFDITKQNKIFYAEKISL